MSYLTQSEAYAILKLPIGADRDAVKSSYKRMAQQWLPEKHQNSTESVNLFSNISKAYSRLCSDGDRVDMDMEDGYKLFNKIVHPKSQKNKAANNIVPPSSGSEEDATNTHSHSSNRKKLQQKESGLNELSNSNEISNRRGESTNNKSSKLERNGKSLNNQDSSSESARRKKLSENDLMQQSRQLSIPNNLLQQQQQQHLLQQSVNDSESTRADEIIIRSRQSAIEGNALANRGLYREAIEQFTKAIELDPNDFRFFGNRSFCYERQGSYDEALADAEKAIALAPEWPKGYFRKGKSLTGSKAFAEAEEAYLQVLKLDSKCPDAKLELAGVRVQRLMEMGFKKQQAINAIQQCETVPAALESLLNNQVPDSPSNDVGSSSDEEDAPKTLSTSSNTVASTAAPAGNSKNDSSNKPSKKQKQQKTPLPPIPQHHYEQAQRQILLNKQQDVVKMNPRNPEGLTSLWVGNVLPEAKQETLVKLFSKYGQLQSVKCIPEKYCAFINFVDKDCAGKAMENLQGGDLFGQKLLIKFPDHPVNPANGEKAPTKNPTKGGQQSRNNTLSSLQSNKQSTSNHTSNAAFINSNSSILGSNSIGNAASLTCSGMGQGSSSNPRTTGPVNGDECYFWRTTGCQFTGTCRYKHVPDHKGIDRKPWHKSK